MMKLLVIAIFFLNLCGMSYAAPNQATQTTPSKETLSNMPIASKNQLIGENFLKENKKKPGVVTLQNGLQYKVIHEGKGHFPKENEIVTVHYAGTLIDGTEFDSSYKRQQPATFPVSGVIPGWTEALKLMRAGSTWMLYIPAALAYGEQGAPPMIGPNETLIFKVELLSIK